MNEKIPNHEYTVINRWKVLKRLIEIGGTKRDLERCLNISRSTIDRSIQDLRDEDLLEQNTLDPTLFGLMLYDAYKRFTNASKSINNAKIILIEQGQTPRLPLEIFDNGKIILNDKECPQKVLMELSKLVADTQHIQIAIPVINSWYLQFFIEFSHSGGSIEVLLEEDIFQKLKSDFDQSWEMIHESNDIRIETTANEIPFALSTLDKDVAWICLYNNRGLEIGGMVSEDDLTVEWARNIYKSYVT
ncbi:transcriptional regulator FilR1 domain-containing protein [Natrinema gari]|uniref:transcriptional regulator FilR1 domain-containing protein n=1 Tax=Natrinema gari TaxID=419186 RepID=UPI0012692FCC|nr:hypothetical protein [Natrinema gari]